MVESIRIPSNAQNTPEAALEIALEGDRDLELTVTTAEGAELWVVVPIADVVGALQLLRASAESDRAANSQNDAST